MPSRREPDLDNPGLAEACAAFTALLDAIVPESRYYQGEREDPDAIAVYGDIIERAAARARRERDQ